MSHNVLLVGLGGIGLRYDLALDARSILTHARAFSSHPEFQLVGGVDPAEERRKQFSEAFHRPAYARLDEALRATLPDLVVVAVPTDAHLPVVEEVLALSRPTAIVCEKPLAYELDKAAAIVELCEQADSCLFVNYMRRADPAIGEIKRRIACRAIQTPVTGVVWYSGGMLNSASHAADLCRHWFGEINNIHLIGEPAPPVARDPVLAFEAGFGDSQFRFLPAGRDEYFVNTIEALAGNGRLYYDLASLVTWQASAPSPLYAGYRHLAWRSESIVCEIRKSQWFFVDALAKTLAGEPSSLSTGREALLLLSQLTRIKPINEPKP